MRACSLCGGLRRLAVVVLCAGGVLALASPSAHARVGQYRLALLRLSYSDASTHLWTIPQYNAAAREIHDFFDRLSYGRLNVQVSVANATLTGPKQTQSNYWTPCAKANEPRVPCPQPLIEDAAQAAAAAGYSFKGIDGILLASPFCQGAYTNDPVQITRPGVTGTFQRSYVFECALPGTLPTPGHSGVAWGGWAHEIGHQLEIDEGDTLQGTSWNGHPSGYASGYELMDSCYPCGESLYGLTGPPLMNGAKKVFPGFLAPERTATVVTPQGATTGQTFTVVPLGTQPADAGYLAGPQALKIPINATQFYEVAGRTNVGADALGTGPGLWDQGVRIRKVDESADPPVTNIESCDFNVAGGCIHNANTDARARACNVSPQAQHRGDVPDYCWPYPLWHAGQSFDDPINDLTIRVVSELPNNSPAQPPSGGGPFPSPFSVPAGFVVTVVRGPQRSGHPDVYITPSDTPPLFTFESADLWVDSSCNGYEHNYRRSLLGGVTDFGVGPTGLRYGRRSDGTVFGTGDDICLDHPNRIYVRLHNIGDRVARNIRVHVAVQLAPGLQIPSVSLGLIDIPGGPLFPPTEIGTVDLAALDPGHGADVYVMWHPRSPPGAPLVGSIPVSLGLSAYADAVTGEVVTTNQHTDEGIDNLQTNGGARLQGAVSIRASKKGPAVRTVDITTPGRRIKSERLVVGNPKRPDHNDYALVRGKALTVPFALTGLRPRAAGTTSFVPIRVGTVTQLFNPAIPSSYGLPRTHNELTVAARVALAVHWVRRTALTIRARRLGHSVIVRGRLAPHIRARIAVDLLAGRRVLRTAHVRTDSSGALGAVFSRVPQGPLRARALWMGDRDHASASARAMRLP
jgi:hypothetical protein